MVGGSLLKMVGQGKVLEQHRLATDGRVVGPKSSVAIWYVEYEESLLLGGWPDSNQVGKKAHTIFGTLGKSIVPFGG